MSTDTGPARDRQTPSLVPIVLLCLVGLLASIMAFFPGWMSADSLDQYSQAKANSFSDWHPPLMQWWWGQLLQVYDGPAMMLMQNLLLYWGAWGLLAAGLRHRFGRTAYIVPLVGFWPGLLFPLGEIWKDILFGCLLIAAWATLIHAHLSARRPRWLERLILLLFATLAVGTKPNGIVALPFLFWYWVHVEGLLARRWIAQVALAAVLTIASMGMAQLPLMTVSVFQQSAFQYTQTYDLLGISLRTGEVLLPEYITDAAGSDLPTLAALYHPDSNNPLAFYTPGTMTYDPSKLEELATRWQEAILAHPLDYLKHRWVHFAALLRLGGGPAFVATPGIDPNDFGLSFTPNHFASWLASAPQRWPGMFLPWLYALVLLSAAAFLVIVRWRPSLVLSLSGSAVAFVAAHFFIVPAADYRYLYYAYLCAMALAAMALVVLLTPHVRALARQLPVARSSAQRLLRDRSGSR